jgi:type II secretory pathway predicted ATPase ExeA
MYEEHFGLRRRPFRATPDAEGYYPATGHEKALAAVTRAQADGEGLALVTGVPGVGKTLLCHCLLERLGRDVLSVFLPNSHFANRADLFQAVLYDLALPHAGRGEQEARLAVTDHLLQNYRAGRSAVLVVDEAQHLSADLLEELRMLGNLEGKQGKALQVVLLSQPTIHDLLRRPELAAFQQRLAVDARVEPLGVHEAADYLVHHVRQAGGRPEAVFSDEALEVLAKGALGVPRLINRAAHQALTLAHSVGADQVDAEAALEALAQLGLTAPECETESDDEPAPADGGTDHTPDAGRVRRLFVQPRRPA